MILQFHIDGCLCFLNYVHLSFHIPLCYVDTITFSRACVSYVCVSAFVCSVLPCNKILKIVGYVM
jgi:hypothetical protein